MPNHVHQKITIPNTKEAQKFLLGLCMNEEGKLASDDPDVCKDISLIGRGDYHFDFNAFVPMPKSIREAESSSTASTGVELLTAAMETPEKPASLLSAYKLRWLKLVEAGICSQAELDEYSASITAAVEDDTELPEAPEFIRNLTMQQLVEKLEAVDDNYIAQGRLHFQNKKEYGVTDWYDWSVKNWGTKWNAYHDLVEVSEDGNSLSVRFQTAWSEPTPILIEFTRRAAEALGDCVITYQSIEEFHHFATDAETHIKNGSVDQGESSLDDVPFEDSEPCHALYANVFGGTIEEWAERIQGQFTESEENEEEEETANQPAP